MKVIFIKEKWTYVCLGLAMLVAYFVYSAMYSDSQKLTSGPQLSLKERKRRHAPKTLTTSQLRKVAQISDTEEGNDYFKLHILKPMLRERVSDTEGNEIVQEHIRRLMQSVNWEITEDTFMDNTPIGTRKFNNIIATLNPKANRKLVLACHHDSKYFVGQEFIGATDSAVPCAMMIDLALRLNDTLWKDYHKMQQEMDLTLQFIFFDGEEAFVRWTDDDSLYGARHLANKMESKMKLVPGQEAEVVEIDLMDCLVLLDLIGTKTTVFKNWFHSTDKHFERLKKIEQRLAKEKMLNPPNYFLSKSNKYFQGGLMRYGGIEDDHIPFLKKGVPILHLISHPFPAEWHKMTDNEEALDYDTIRNIRMIIQVFVVEYLKISP